MQRFVLHDRVAASAQAVFVEEKLAAGTEAMKGAFQVLCGPVEVPHKPAERMLEQRGVGGVWVAWPNADTSDSAPTVLYLHGGESHLLDHVTESRQLRRPEISSAASRWCLAPPPAGGMVQGTCDWTFGFLGRLSRAFGLRVLSVEYPLCPGATAVEAVDGMVSAFRHLTEDLKVRCTSFFDGLVGSAIQPLQPGDPNAPHRRRKARFGHGGCTPSPLCGCAAVAAVRRCRPSRCCWWASRAVARRRC